MRNKKPIFAVDLDEVVCEMYRFLYDLAIVDHRDKLLPTSPKKRRGISFFDHFNLEEKDLESILDVYHTDAILKLRLIAGAREGIARLHEEGEVWIISARPDSVIEYSKEWLAKRNIAYDKIIHTDHSEGKYAYINDVSCLIEDTAKTALYFAENGTPAVLFGYHINKPYINTNLSQLRIVKNWTEAASAAIELVR